MFTEAQIAILVAIGFNIVLAAIGWGAMRQQLKDLCKIVNGDHKKLDDHLTGANGKHKVG